MNAWLNFAASPLRRHPSLLARKMARRLGGSPRLSFDHAPASLAFRAPDRLAAGLRDWMGRADLDDRRFPFGRVFRQDFDEDVLLALCKTGPKGTPDLLGDIKLIWEFSRGYAITLNAAQRHPAEAIAPHVKMWLEANRDPRGLNWQCAMEIAIRAVNWICADALLAGSLRASLDPAVWDRWLWLHGRAIWTQCEARLVSSNHYIANLLGLLYIGASFPDDARARAWYRWARSEMPRALAAQTHKDGGVYEASLPYHALVTEMALLFLLLEMERADASTRQRIRAMCRVIADTLDADGDVFRVGDDDGGRVIPLDFISRSLGRGQILLALAETIFDERWAPSSGLYPHSGWWIARQGSWAVLLEFGGVGLAGLGAHAHNDTLSVCVNVFGKRLLVDPGSYLYTSSPADRNRFRSTMCHNTLMVDQQEQCPIPAGPHDVFRLPGPRRALRVLDQSANHVRVAGRLPLGVTRTVRVEERRLIITDRVEGGGPHTVTWFFHWAPDICPLMENNRIEARLPGGRIVLSASQPVQCRLEPAEYSPFYGTRMPITRLRAEWRGALPCEVTWALEKQPAS